MTTPLYMSAEEYRAKPGAVTTADDDGYIEDLIEEFAETAEDYRSVAYVPRETVETFTNPGTVIVLAHRRVADVAIEVNGDELDADRYSFTEGGVITFVSCPTGTVVVTYTHGYAETPKRIIRACVEYVSSVLRADSSGQSRDVIAQGFDGGFTRYSTPDKDAGRPTGWLEVDRLLDSMPDYDLPDVA